MRAVGPGLEPLPGGGALPSDMRTVPASEARDAYLAGAVFLDVRAAAQYRRDGLPRSRNLTLEAIQTGDVPDGVGTDEQVYLVCDRGQISELAGLYLEQAGFRTVANVRGGLAALRPLLR